MRNHEFWTFQLSGSSYTRHVKYLKWTKSRCSEVYDTFVRLNMSPLA